MTPDEQDTILRLTSVRDGYLAKLKQADYLNGRAPERNYSLAHDILVAYNNSLEGVPRLLRIKKKHRG